MAEDKRHDEATARAAFELHELFRAQTLTVGGEQVTVHEFSFAEELELLPLARPILEGLRRLLADAVAGEAAGETGAGISAEALDLLISEHRETWLTLIARNIGHPVEWVRRLPGSDGQSLSLAFWGAAGAFFLKRLITGAEITREAARLRASPRASTKSSPR